MPPPTPDQMIGKGEVEAAREGRRVCVKMHGPRHPGVRCLLRRTRVDRPELTVGRLAEGFSHLQPAEIIDAAGIPCCLLSSITRRPANATSGAAGRSGTTGAPAQGAVRVRDPGERDGLSQHRRRHGGPGRDHSQRGGPHGTRYPGRGVDLSAAPLPGSGAAGRIVLIPKVPLFYAGPFL